VSLTGPPPPLPPIVASPPTPAEVPSPVMQILGAAGIGSVGGSTQDVLNAATGPGNVVTGTVAELSTSGNVTIVTPQGLELTLHDPPAQILQLGSQATLRITTNTTVPQATLLAVDGKPVAGLLARVAGTTEPPPASTVPIPVATPSAPAITGAASPLIDSTLALVASLAASIEAEDAALLQAMGQPTQQPQTPGTSAGAAGTATMPVPQPQTAGASLIATLIQTALPRPGGVSPPIGTRYAVILTAVSSVDTGEETAGSEGAPPPPEAAPAAEAAPPPPQAAAVPTGAPAQPPASSPPPAAPPALPAGSDFVRQATVLAGRVLPPGPSGETLIKTALGTLSLPETADPPPVGAAVQLKVFAAAPPLPGFKPTGLEASLPMTESAGPESATLSPIAEAMAALAMVEPEQAKAVETQLALQPGPQLAAAFFSFLAGTAPSVSRRWAESPARKTLDAIDRPDLKSRLDVDAAEMGQTRPPAYQGDWAVTILPYLGMASTQPIRVYRKQPGDKKGVTAQRAGEHFVIEVELKRLGQMQFEGLVRERRFDLMLRSNRILEPELQTLISRVFRDAAGIGGYAGDIAFGHLVAFPLVPLGGIAPHREVSA
jgi:hypothetical protein